jgi:hypothetical protein
MEILMERKRRSESLSKDEHKAFLKFIHGFPTKTDAAFEIGISRQVLDGVSLKGSGSPDSIKLIRERLNTL